MHDVYLRLFLLRNRKVFEVTFDNRMSFSDNLKMISKLENEISNDFKVFDNDIGVFVNTKIPLSELNLERFTLFYLL